ncbi:MAG: hypothetical protein ACYDEG_10150 [bacterium]
MIVYLRDENGVAIKKSFYRWRQYDMILRSDNPMFPERVIDKKNTDDFSLIGRVICVI